MALLKFCVCKVYHDVISSTAIFCCVHLRVQNKDLPVENTTECLSTMASICRTMIENP